MAFTRTHFQYLMDSVPADILEDCIRHIRSEVCRYTIPETVIQRMVEERLMYCKAHNIDPRNYNYVEVQEQIEWKMCTVFKWEKKNASNNGKSSSSNRGEGNKSSV